jgi:hypothetical protein
MNKIALLKVPKLLTILKKINGQKHLQDQSMHKSFVFQSQNNNFIVQNKNKMINITSFI